MFCTRNGNKQSMHGLSFTEFSVSWRNWNISNARIVASVIMFEEMVVLTTMICNYILNIFIKVF